jgi:Uma2 family endonuclease
MSLGQTVESIVYPESDGKPMGETDVHIDWMIRIRDILKYRYRGQRVYVASNLLVYYEEGRPNKYVVPDDFVVLDCDPGQRRTFRIWEEKRTPDVVFEVTSASTKREDERVKPKVYARMGVQELFLYDPTAEYLKPALQGFRLLDDEYSVIEPDVSGVLRCNALDIGLRLQSRDLLLIDLESGKLLPSEAEAAESARHMEKAARETAEAARQQEQAAREAAETRAAELEAEIQRLRAEVKRLTPDS